MDKDEEERSKKKKLKKFYQEITRSPVTDMKVNLSLLPLYDMFLLSGHDT